MGKSFWLVVQYPMKSESGNQRYTRLKIATMPYDSDKTDKTYTLKYGDKKGDTDFSL